MGVIHKTDNAYSIRNSWLCYWLVRFLAVDYSGKHCIFDLSPIDLLLISYTIWMCHFDSVVSLGVESDNQAFD